MPRDDATEQLPREQSPQPRADEALRQRINSAWSRLLRGGEQSGPANADPDAAEASGQEGTSNDQTNDAPAEPPGS